MISGQYTPESSQPPRTEVRFARLAATKRFGSYASGRQMIIMNEIQQNEQDTRMKQRTDENENLGDNNE